MRRFPELVIGFLLGFSSLLIIFIVSSDLILHKVVRAIDAHNGLVTAMATAFIAWFTLSLKRSTDRLWDAGERQLKQLADTSAAQSRDMQTSIAAAQEANRLARENAIAERRAWLDVSDVKLVEPTAFQETGLIVRIQYKITNLGQSIARNVDSHVELWCAEASSENFPTVRERLLERGRKTPVELGAQMFPKDDFTNRLLFEERPEKFARGVRTRPDGVRTFALHIFITVSYRIDGESAPRITQYVYDLLNATLPSAVQPSQSLNLRPEPFLAAIIE